MLPFFSALPSKGRWCSARPYPTGLRFCALRTALMRLGVAAVFIFTIRLASPFSEQFREVFPF